MIVTLADMKIRLGIDSGDTTSDDFLTSQLDTVQEAIEAYCERKFDEYTYTEDMYSSDYCISNRVQLHAFPVTAVTSITEDMVTVDPTTYRYTMDSAIITRTDGRFFWGYNTITTFTYVAGYAYNKMPKILQDVVYSAVAERYNKKSAGIDLNFGSDVQRISIPGTISVDFDYSLNNNDRSTAFGGIIGNSLNSLDYYRSERAIIGSGKLEYIAIT